MVDAVLGPPAQSPLRGQRPLSYERFHQGVGAEDNRVSAGGSVLLGRRLRITMDEIKISHISLALKKCISWIKFISCPLPWLWFWGASFWTVLVIDLRFGGDNFERLALMPRLQACTSTHLHQVGLADRSCSWCYHIYFQLGLLLSSFDLHSSSLELGRWIWWIPNDLQVLDREKVLFLLAKSIFRGWRSSFVDRISLSCMLQRCSIFLKKWGINPISWIVSAMNKELGWCMLLSWY